MSLFMDDPNNTPVDRARELLLHRAGIWHEGLKWRTDTLRNLAEQLDALDEMMQAGVATVVWELQGNLRPQLDHQDGQLEADDTGKSR